MNGNFLGRLSLKDIVAMTEVVSPEIIAEEIVQGGLVHIRNVADGEEAYHYSSGNWGPMYVTVKGGCSNQNLFKFMARQLSLRVSDITDFDFVAGLVTGGVPPSIYLRDWVQEMQDREIPWVYIRDTRKLGGTKEHVTGLYMPNGQRSLFIPEGAVGLVVEELVNYANSTTNGAILLRSEECKCGCRRGVTILDYDNPVAHKYRAKYNVELTSVVKMTEVLDAIQRIGLYSDDLVEDARWSQRDPQEWMGFYGLEKTELKK
ncbi:MAG: hypothetical protein NTZ65_04125 [Candidatus Berkelbacteria bacterium]|nr:hypothetical protein [Candidatus Berkelbacteria bacterium]